MSGESGGKCLYFTRKPYRRLRGFATFRLILTYLWWQMSCLHLWGQGFVRKPYGKHSVCELCGKRWRHCLQGCWDWKCSSFCVALAGMKKSSTRAAWMRTRSRQRNQCTPMTTRASLRRLAGLSLRMSSAPRPWCVAWEGTLTTAWTWSPTRSVTTSNDGPVLYLLAWSKTCSVHGGVRHPLPHATLSVSSRSWPL